MINTNATIDLMLQTVQIERFPFLFAQQLFE